VTKSGSVLVSINQAATDPMGQLFFALISLNAQLLLLPPELVTYVLVHKLCHTKHLNHSPRFWRLLEYYLPDYRQFHRQMRNGSRWMPGWLTA
jgi:hypothetical protein